MSKCFSKPEIGIDEYSREAIRKSHENWDTDFETPEQYVDFKLVMLRNDMYIEPTEDEVAHLKTLKTETAIDNAVHSIISRHWSEF